MANRLPENYNIYPWRNINWQPDYRGGKIRRFPEYITLKQWVEKYGEPNFFISCIAGKEGYAILHLTNDSEIPHSLTSDFGYFQSGLLLPKQTYTIQKPLFANSYYTFHCDLHDESGIIHVSPPPINR